MIARSPSVQHQCCARIDVSVLAAELASVPLATPRLLRFGIVDFAYSPPQLDSRINEGELLQFSGLMASLDFLSDGLFYRMRDLEAAWDLAFRKQIIEAHREARFGCIGEYITLNC